MPRSSIRRGGARTGAVPVVNPGGVHWGYNITQDGYNNAGGFNAGAIATLSSVKNAIITTHIGGFGVYPPETSDGVYDWGGEIRGVPLNGLDDGVAHVQAFSHATTGIDMITLCSAPGWMKASGADFSMSEAPTDAMEQKFADECAAIVAHYPTVQWFTFWNEKKGMDNPVLANFQKYVRMYNLAWTAMKAVRSTIKIGGPYDVWSSWEEGMSTGDGSSSYGYADVNFTGGRIDRRILDSQRHFHDNALGWDFWSVDIWCGNQFHTGKQPFTAPEFANAGDSVAPGRRAHDQIDKFIRCIQWVRANIEPLKPIVVNEFYPQAQGSNTYRLAGFDSWTENDVGDWVIEIMTRTRNECTVGQGIWYLQWGENAEVPRPFDYSTGAELPYVIPKLRTWEG